MISFMEIIGPIVLFASCWTLLTFVILPNIWKHFPGVFQWYSKQNDDQKLDWDCRTTAIIHSSIIFILCFFLILFDENFTYTEIYSKTDNAILCLQFSTGYFLSDMVVLHKLQKYYGIATLGYLGHHIVSILGITQTISGGAGAWFTALRLCTELSTPFVNLGFMFDQCKLEGTKIYAINRHIGFWSFILCRPVMIPVFWYCTSLHFSTGDFWEIEKGTQWLWIITGVTLDVLNIIWTNALYLEYKKWMSAENTVELTPSCKSKSSPESIQSVSLEKRKLG